LATGKRLNHGCAKGIVTKAKFGTTLRSKGDISQMNELLCKVLCHNICVVIQSMYELGIEADFGV
jgi:hypothetical protein